MPITPHRVKTDPRSVLLSEQKSLRRSVRDWKAARDNFAARITAECERRGLDTARILANDHHLADINATLEGEQELLAKVNAQLKELA